MKAVIAAAVLCLAAAMLWSPEVDAPPPPPGPEPVLAEAVAADLPQELHEAFAEPVSYPPAADDAEGVVERDTDEPAYATVTGRVVGADGTPLRNASVVLSSAERVVSTVADEAGDFELHAYPDTYEVVARADEHVPAVEQGLALSEGEQVDGVMLTLDPGARIRGTVHNEQLEPVGDLVVVAKGQGYVRQARTNEQGAFELLGLPPGTYSVLAHSEGEGGDEQQVRTGDTVALKLGLHTQVVVKVVDWRGFPVEGATVYSDYVSLPMDDETDPYPVGETEGVAFGLGTHGCGPSPECYERGVTGPDGKVSVETSPGQTLIVAAVKGADVGHRGGITHDDGMVLLQITPPTTKLTLVGENGAPRAGRIELITEHRLMLRSEIETAEDGAFDLPSWSGVTLRLPAGSEVRGELPSGVAVEKPRTLHVYEIIIE